MPLNTNLNEIITLYCHLHNHVQPMHVAQYFSMIKRGLEE